MASKVAIGKMRYEAMARVQDAMPLVAQKLGIPVVDIPTQGRDLDLLHVRQLEAHAEFYERVLGGVDAVQTQVHGLAFDKNDIFERFYDVLSHLTVKQLEALAKANDVEPSGTKKDDLIWALIVLPGPEVVDGEGDAPEEGDSASDEENELEEDASETTDEVEE